MLPQGKKGFLSRRVNNFLGFFSGKGIFVSGMGFFLKKSVFFPSGKECSAQKTKFLLKSERCVFLLNNQSVFSSGKGRVPQKRKWVLSHEKKTSSLHERGVLPQKSGLLPHRIGFYLIKRIVLFMKGAFYLKKADFHLKELGFTS